MKKFSAILIAVIMLCGVCALAACSPNDGSARTGYKIQAVYDEEKGVLSATERVDYCNKTDNEVGELKFNLYGSAFSENAKIKPVSESYFARAYYGGASYGGMEITSVSGCESWQTAGEDGNVLSVVLSSPVYPGERATVEISYELTLARVNHRTGITDAGTINLGNFYPVLCAYSAQGFVESPYYSCGDPFLSECADYEVELDLPEGMKVASSGTQLSENSDGGRVKTQHVLTNARDFAVVLSRNFKVAEGKAAGADVRYYYVSDADPEGSVKAAEESLEYFAGEFGSYQYPTLSVVETGFCYGGMEYPALTMIARGQESGERAYTIVHENAHQWWYAMVGSDQLNAAWQDEGLAEYSSLMFFENNPDYGFTRTGLIGSATRAYRAFFSVSKQLKDEVDTSMNRNLSQYTSEFEYSNITYNKGMLLFETLRNSVGDEKFAACLKKYFDANKGLIASPESLISVFVKSGADVEGVFGAFLDGKIII